MTTRKKKFALRATCTGVAASMLWLPGTAWAQAVAAPAAPPPATPPAATPAPPPAPEPAPAAVAPAAEPAPAAPAAVAPAPPPPPVEAAPPPEPPPPPAEEDKLPPIDVGAWLRVGYRIQGTDASKLNDASFDTVYGELHLGGKVHKNVSYTLNFNASGLGATAGIMDAIIGLDLCDEFHLWSGQLLTPVDRTNFSGPFFIAPWTYTGLFGVVLPGAPFVTPQGEDVAGRSIGSVAWGDIGGKGEFKYYLGAMRLNNPAEHPLYSGRLAWSPIGGEPGYYGSSVYYGDKDVVAIGVGAQYQKDGSVAKDADGNVTASDSYSEFNADILGEMKVGDGGAVTGEAGFYHFGGDYEPAKDMFYITGSYLTSPVGPGKLMPTARFQWAKRDEMKVTQVDLQLAYVLAGPAMRALVGYSRVDYTPGANADTLKGNMIQFGLQTIMF